MSDEPLVWERVEWRQGDGRYRFEVERGGLHAKLTAPHGSSLTLPIVSLLHIAQNDNSPLPRGQAMEDGRETGNGTAVRKERLAVVAHQEPSESVS